jgi:LmbE family N-acetylglucosaminyl deacetylase
MVLPVRGESVRNSAWVVIAVTLVIVLLAYASTPDRTPPVAATTVRFVQVVAHADDDVIFMNPDLASGIRAGHPTAGIYLTAGETDKADAEAYAARRQAGTRAAYARMAGVADEWHAERLDVNPKHAVELYTLRAKPHVQVVFVNLPESNDPRAAGGREALVRLWRDSRDTLRVNTLVPVGGAVQQSYVYTHNDVVQLLVGLFNRFEPTVVRAQDPNPDNRYFRASPRFHDHPDHVMTARFTAAAAALYTGPRFVFENYRDYNVADAPVNLTPADQRDKADIFGAYVPHDSETSLGPPYDTWLPRMYQRYPRGSSWFADGKAYVVFSGRLFTGKPDGTWDPLPWADGPLLPAVSAANGWIAGKRANDNEIVAFIDGSWRSLTVRGISTLGDLAQVGSPVTDGVSVYVKNARGGVSVWRPGRDWTEIGGTDLQDGLVVAGEYVFASTRDKVMRWVDDKLDPGFALPRAAGPPAVTMLPSGPAVTYRTDSGEIALSSGNGIQILGGLSGSGNPAIGAAGSRVFVFARTSAGGLAANSGSGWTDLGGQILDQPAATGAGAVAVGPDGRLHTYSAS